MIENKKISQNILSCVHCGLDVLFTGFMLDTLQGQKFFCCAGCKAIYKMLNNDIDSRN